MKQYASYRQLWQALLPYYDEREAQAVVRMMLEERFGLTLTDIVCGGVARLDASPDFVTFSKYVCKCLIISGCFCCLGRRAKSRVK